METPAPAPRRSRSKKTAGPEYLDLPALGTKLKAARGDRQQKEIADAAGVSQPTVSCAEKGADGFVAEKNLRKVAEAVGLTLVGPFYTLE